MSTTPCARLRWALDIDRWCCVRRGVRFAYGRSFTDEQVIADKGAQMYQGQVQLASMTQSLFGHMGIILRMSGEPFATLTGKVARITELDEVMQVRRTEHNWC